MRLALLVGLVSMSALSPFAHASEKRVAGFDAAAQRRFVQSAKKTLDDAGVDAKIFPGARKLGKPYLGTIRVTVNSAKQVGKAFALLAPKGDRGTVQWTTTKKDRPNLIYSSTGAAKDVVFSVGTKHGYAGYELNLDDD